MNSIKFAFAIAIFCASTTHAQPTVKALVVLSTRFVQFAGNPQKAQALVQREISVVNESFVRQKIDLGFEITGTEVLDLHNEVDPNELCQELEGSLQDPSLTSIRFNSIRELRASHKADVVIFMVNSASGLLAESGNFGLTCRGNPNASAYAQRDNSYVIVDRLGLKTLTLPHELGHFLGIKDHNFASPQPKLATLMAANGQGFERIPYWSDRDYLLHGKSLMPSQGEPDDEVIRRNIPLTTNRCMDWLKSRQ